MKCFHAVEPEPVPAVTTGPNKFCMKAKLRRGSHLEAVDKWRKIKLKLCNRQIESQLFAVVGKL